VALPLVMEVGVIVLEIRPEELAHYRRHIESFKESVEHKNQRIQAMANVILSIIDKECGLDPVQIIAKLRLKDSFQKSASDVIVSHRHDATQIDLFADERLEGATPRNRTENKGCAP
jgi:beta-glucosidase/6-phospho-beta-glucosidase/beta-galactosidase